MVCVCVGGDFYPSWGYSLLVVVVYHLICFQLWFFLWGFLPVPLIFYPKFPTDRLYFSNSVSTFCTYEWAHPFKMNCEMFVCVCKEWSRFRGRCSLRRWCWRSSSTMDRSWPCITPLQVRMWVYRGGGGLVLHHYKSGGGWVGGWVANLHWL